MKLPRIIGTTEVDGDLKRKGIYEASSWDHWNFWKRCMLFEEISLRTQTSPTSLVWKVSKDTCHIGFLQSKNDPSMVLHQSLSRIAVLLIYVDDIIITRTDSEGIRLQPSLHASLHKKDLGTLTYFQGLEVHPSTSGISINQHKYTKDLIALAWLENSTPVDTPLKVNVKYSKDEGELLSDDWLGVLSTWQLQDQTLPMQLIWRVNLWLNLESSSGSC